MKTYKQLIESIVSALPRTHTGHVQDGPTNSDTDGNFQDVENPEISDRINAALAHLNRLPTSNPKQRVVEIKVALSHAGIDFDHTSVNIAQGEKSEVSAKRWGGRVGMDEDGTFINDDGFGDNPHVIQFEWTKQDHMWNLVAEMKPAILGEQMMSAPTAPRMAPPTAPSTAGGSQLSPDDYEEWEDLPYPLRPTLPWKGGPLRRDHVTPDFHPLDPDNPDYNPNWEPGMPTKSPVRNPWRNTVDRFNPFYGEPNMGEQMGEQMGGGMVSAPTTPVGVNPVSAKGGPIQPGDVIPDDYNDGVNPYNWEDNYEQWQQWQDNWTTPISPMDDEGNPNPKYWD